MYKFMAAIGLILLSIFSAHSQERWEVLDGPSGGLVQASAIATQSQEHPGQNLEQRIVLKVGPNCDTATSVRTFTGTAAHPDLGKAVFFVGNDDHICYQFFQRWPNLNPQWRQYGNTDNFVVTDDVETHRNVSDGAEMTFRWNEKLNSLAVRVHTRDEDHAKTGDDVWFDVGFKGWKIDHTLNTRPGASDTFEQNSTETFNLPLPGNDYFVDDIFEMRLEKKGLFGYTGLEDGINGGWKPEWIQLIVNGHEFTDHVPVLGSGEELDHNRPAWRVLFKPYTAEQRFAYGLRVQINPLLGGSALGELAAPIATKFKEAGISGWQKGPIRESDPELHASALGILRQIHPGHDCGVSLDLELQNVTIGGQTYVIGAEQGDPDGVPHQRYIRIEYKYLNASVCTENRGDLRFKHWQNGQTFFANGIVKWDTDIYGFFEIHPQSPEAIHPVTQ